MIGLLVVAHGSLANGFKNAVELICGSQEQFLCVDLEPEMGPQELRAKLTEAVDQLDQGEGVLMFVDLLGGTPCNVSLEVTAVRKATVVAGTNLGTILEALSRRHAEESLVSLRDALVEVGKEAVIGLDLNSRVE